MSMWDYRQNYVKIFENICFTKRTSNRVLKCLVGSKQTDYILMIDIHITTLSQIPILFY